MTQMDRNIRLLIFIASASFMVFVGFQVAKGIHHLQTSILERTAYIEKHT